MRPSRPFALLATALLIAPSLTAQAPDWSVLARPRSYTGPATTAAITAGDLKTRLYRFADDSMGGRLLGSEGNFKGVEYIASEVKKFGLQPAGENGTYFQAVPVVTDVVDSTVTLTAGSTTLRTWVDYIPRDQGRNTRSIDGVPVVFGGSWGDSASLIDPAMVAGKLVVLALAPAGTPEGSPPGTANRFAVSAYFKSAAGIAVVGMDLIPKEAYNIYRSIGPLLVNDKVAETPAYMYVTKAAATAMLGAPVDSARTGAAGGSIHGNPHFLAQQFGSYPARNVVAILPGSDPVLKNEYVAIGAHNDHIGLRGHPVMHDSVYIMNHLFKKQGVESDEPKLTEAQAREFGDALAAIRKKTNGASARPDSINNGADDDGTGSVSVLEIAQYFASQAHRPRRSLLFVWHVGEELGLFGSQYFTDNPTVPRDSIVAQLNIDMVGRGATSDITGITKEGAQIHGNPNYVQVIGSRRNSTELGDLAVTVDSVDHHKLAFDYALDANGHPQNIYCRSDHYEYARYGIPIIFFTTGGHADYHQVTDEPQYIDYNRMARIDNFVADLATHVANLDHRPLVDHPKPDPQGACQQ